MISSSVPIELLSIVSRLPPKFLSSLLIAPGWSYIGSHRLIENKISPGVYGSSILSLPEDRLLDPSMWSFCRVLPRYNNLMFLTCSVPSVIDFASRHCSVIGQVVSDIVESSDSLVINFVDGDRYEFSGDPLICAYSFLASAYRDGIALSTPAVKDLVGALDFSRVYRGEPTVIYSRMPDEFLLGGKYFSHYSSSVPEQLDSGGYCVGQIQLMEGVFWVVVQRLSAVRKKFYSKEDLHHVGGIIYRH